MRVRIRRFRDLSRWRLWVRLTFRRWGFAAPRFLSGFTLSAPGKLRRSGLAGAWPRREPCATTTITVRAFIRSRT